MSDTLAKHCTYIAAPAQAHQWIMESFRGQLVRNTPGGPRDSAGQARALVRAIRCGAAKAMIAVPRGEPDAWLGWAAAMGGALMFAYVRHGLRHGNIGTELIGSVTDGTPIDVAYWTKDAIGMARHGVPLRYSIDAYQALLSFVRGPGQSPERRAA